MLCAHVNDIARLLLCVFCVAFESLVQQMQHTLLDLTFYLYRIQARLYILH